MTASSSPTPSVDFSGVVPPVATPLRSDGTIDHASLTRLVEHLITSGVSGLFALGSTGETAYFTDDQRIEIVQNVVATAAGRVPVISGAIELTASRILAFAQRLEAAGVDAIVTTAPLYTLNSQAEIANHFRSIANGLSVPLWAYDVPVRVHSKLSHDLLIELGLEGIIKGVKDSSGDDVGFRRLVAANNAAGHPLQLLTGHEVIVDAMALIGADGVVPGLANVEAAGYVRLWNSAKAGDWDAARGEQERLNRLFEIVFQPEGLSGDATGVGAFKAAMQARGIIDNARMAHPVESIGDAGTERIRSILKELNFVDTPVA